jgi:hypothetical protein
MSFALLLPNTDTNTRHGEEFGVKSVTTEEFGVEGDSTRIKSDSIRITSDQTEIER